MNVFILLFRGINVGGKNKVPMAELRQCLETLGFLNVVTYIASGNAIVSTSMTAKMVAKVIEAELPKQFALDDKRVRVLVLSPQQLRVVIDGRPKGFGDQPDMYHSDAIFLIDVHAKDALGVFQPKEGVDVIWPGKGVIYSQRLSALRTKSRLNRIMGTPMYKNMTIRNWNTVVALQKLLEKAQGAK